MKNPTNRVAYIVTARFGLEAFVFTEIDALSKLGCGIVLFTTKYGHGPYMPRDEWATYTVRIFPVLGSQLRAIFHYGVWYWRVLAEAVRMGTLADFLIGAHYSLIMRKDRISHIHCHMGDRKLFVGYYAHRLCDLPLTVTVHAHEMLASAPKPDGKMFRRALTSCSKVLTISEYNKRFLNENHGVQVEKIRVIRLFAGKERVKRNLRRIKLLMVANWVPKKGHRPLLEALKALDRNDWSLWIAGQSIDLGDRSIDVAAMVEELGLNGQVSILGAVSDEILAALFQACDVFCVPSVVEVGPEGGIVDQEGIPEVLKEAMTYGKPVITTRHTGIPELVSESLVEENNVPELSKAIVRLLDDEDLRRAEGERNQAKIETMYSNSDLSVLLEVFSSSGRS